MSAKAPGGFRFTDAALQAVRKLLRRGHTVAYVCQVTRGDTEEWSVVSFSDEYAPAGELVQVSGIPVFFQRDGRDALLGKTLDWVDGHGFQLI